VARKGDFRTHGTCKLRCKLCAKPLRG